MSKMVKPWNKDQLFQEKKQTENCEDCSHQNKSINDNPMCYKIMKEIPWSNYENGDIPHWCPLPTT